MAQPGISRQGGRPANQVFPEQAPGSSPQASRLLSKKKKEEKHWAHLSSPLQSNLFQIPCSLSRARTRTRAVSGGGPRSSLVRLGAEAEVSRFPKSSRRRTGRGVGAGGWRRRGGEWWAAAWGLADGDGTRASFIASPWLRSRRRSSRQSRSSHSAEAQPPSGGTRPEAEAAERKTGGVRPTTTKRKPASRAWRSPARWGKGGGGVSRGGFRRRAPRRRPLPTLASRPPVPPPVAGPRGLTARAAARRGRRRGRLLLRRLHLRCRSIERRRHRLGLGPDDDRDSTPARRVANRGVAGSTRSPPLPPAPAPAPAPPRQHDVLDLVRPPRRHDKLVGSPPPILPIPSPPPPIPPLPPPPLPPLPPRPLPPPPPPILSPASVRQGARERGRGEEKERRRGIGLTDSKLPGDSPMPMHVS
ncbi:uncharacterized protein [Oryza sativa Japonica Group]|uniref:uncharacterized protein n=1 Tax=Oryza sativa subsp. japonica TaxID=39947 RepID=UPI00339C4653